MSAHGMLLFQHIHMILSANTPRRDTVCSVGIVPPSHTLPFTSSNTSIRYFRHAISLDEHRAKFKANYYHLRKPEDQKGTSSLERCHGQIIASLTTTEKITNTIRRVNRTMRNTTTVSMRRMWRKFGLLGVTAVIFSLSRGSVLDPDIVLQTLAGDRSRMVHGTAWPESHFAG